MIALTKSDTLMLKSAISQSMRSGSASFRMLLIKVLHFFTMREKVKGSRACNERKK